MWAVCRRRWNDENQDRARDEQGEERIDDVQAGDRNRDGTDHDRD